MPFIAPLTASPAVLCFIAHRSQWRIDACSLTSAPLSLTFSDSNHYCVNVSCQNPERYCSYSCFSCSMKTNSTYGYVACISGHLVIPLQCTWDNQKRNSRVNMGPLGFKNPCGPIDKTIGKTFFKAYFVCCTWTQKLSTENLLCEYENTCCIYSRSLY